MRLKRLIVPETRLFNIMRKFNDHLPMICWMLNRLKVSSAWSTIWAFRAWWSAWCWRLLMSDLGQPVADEDAAESGGGIYLHRFRVWAHHDPCPYICVKYQLVCWPGTKIENEQGKVTPYDRLFRLPAHYRWNYKMASDDVENDTFARDEGSMVWFGLRWSDIECGYGGLTLIPTWFRRSWWRRWWRWCEDNGSIENQCRSDEA